MSLSVQRGSSQGFKPAFVTDEEVRVVVDQIAVTVYLRSDLETVVVKVTPAPRTRTDQIVVDRVNADGSSAMLEVRAAK